MLFAQSRQRAAELRILARCQQRKKCLFFLLVGAGDQRFKCIRQATAYPGIDLMGQVVSHRFEGVTQRQQLTIALFQCRDMAIGQSHRVFH